MSALLLLFLLLLAIGLLCVLYMAAWWTLDVQRGSKEGSYVINNSNESNNKSNKLYTGLDMVDEGVERQRLVLKEDDEDEKKEQQSNDTNPVHDQDDREEQDEHRLHVEQGLDEGKQESDEEQQQPLPQDSPA